MSDLFTNLRSNYSQLAVDQLVEKHSVQYEFMPHVHQLKVDNQQIYPVTFRRINGVHNEVDNFCAMFASMNALSCQPAQREIIRMYNARLPRDKSIPREFIKVCHLLFKKHKELNYLLPVITQYDQNVRTPVDLEHYQENNQLNTRYIECLHDLLYTMNLTFTSSLRDDNLRMIKTTILKFYNMELVQALGAGYYTSLPKMFRHAAFAIYAAYSFISTTEVATDACTIKTRGTCYGEPITCCNLFMLPEMTRIINTNNELSNSVQDMVHLSEVTPCLFPSMNQTITYNELNLGFEFGDIICPISGTKTCEIISTPLFFYVEIPGYVQEAIHVTNYEMVELPKNKKTNEASKYILTGVVLKGASEGDEHHYTYLDVRFNSELRATCTFIDDLATNGVNVNLHDYMSRARILLYTRVDHVKFVPDALIRQPMPLTGIKRKATDNPKGQGTVNADGDTSDMKSSSIEPKGLTFPEFCIKCEQYEDKDLYDYLTIQNTHFESLCEQVKATTSIKIRKIKHARVGLYWLRRLSPLSCEDFFVGALNHVTAREMYYEYIEDMYDSFDSRGAADMHKVRLYTNVNEREMYQQNHMYNSSSVWEKNGLEFYDKSMVQSNQFKYHQNEHQLEYPSLFNLVKIITSRCIRNINTELRCHMLLKHLEQGVFAQDLLKLSQDIRTNGLLNSISSEFLLPLLVFGTNMHSDLYLRNLLFNQDFISSKTLNKNVALCSLAFTVYSTAMTRVLQDVSDLNAPRNALMVSDLVFEVEDYLKLISDIVYDSKQGRLTVEDMKLVISITDDVDGHINKVQRNAISLSFLFKEDLCEASKELHTCCQYSFVDKKTIFRLPCENIQTHLLENFGYAHLQKGTSPTYDPSRLNRMSYVIDKYHCFLYDQVNRQSDNDQRILVSHSVLGEQEMLFVLSALLEVHNMFSVYLSTESPRHNESKESVLKRRKAESLEFLYDLSYYIEMHTTVFNKPLFILTNAFFVTSPHYSSLNLYQICLRLMTRDTDITISDDGSHYHEFLVDAILKCFIGVHYMDKDQIRDRSNSQASLSTSIHISDSIMSFLQHKKIILENTPIDEKLRIMSIEDNMALKTMTGKLDAMYSKMCDSFTEADKEDSFIWELLNISYIPPNLMYMLHVSNIRLHMKTKDVHKMVITDHLSVAAEQLNNNVCSDFIFQGTIPLDLHSEVDMELKQGQTRMDVIYDALEKRAKETETPQMIMMCRQYYNNMKRALHITSLQHIFSVCGGKSMNETLWKILVSIRVSLLRDHKGVKYYYDAPVIKTSSGSTQGTITEDLELATYLSRQLIRYDKNTVEQMNNFTSHFIYLLFKAAK